MFALLMFKTLAGARAGDAMSRYLDTRSGPTCVDCLTVDKSSQDALLWRQPFQTGTELVLASHLS